MSIGKEYARWKQVREVLARGSSLSEKSRYELENIIERYILSVDNKVPNAEEKMRSELLKKGIPLGGLAVALRPTGKTLDWEIKETSSGFQIGEFALEKSPRVERLIELGGLDATMRMCLRYESTCPRGQQWGVPWKTAEVLFSAGFANEGFASPLNSRFLDLSGKYCSLYDCDRPFGSLGSFFEQDLLSIEGGWMINPPMVEALLDRVVTKILFALDKCRGEKLFFLSMGAWTDCLAYKKLANSPHLFHSRTLKPGKYVYQTPNQEIISAMFPSVYFFLGKENLLNVEGEQFYTRLEESWSI
jgi:hypothetical protein